MIIAKSPLRISIAGGGTDIPEFYSKHGSKFISAAIDKYIYIIVQHRFEPEIRVSYLKNEYVGDVKDIEHPMVREVLREYRITDHCEIISSANLPGTSGLGSSGAFAVALISALNRYSNTKTVFPPELAYNIEREVLKRPTGKQDQYVAYHGGLRQYSIDECGRVVQHTISNSDWLNKHLVMFYTGLTRDSSTLLRFLPSSESQLIQIQKLEDPIHTAISLKDVDVLGALFDTHWKIKKSISPQMSRSYIDECYEIAMKNGALGGKIVGAGGGGFLLFVYDAKEDHFLLSEVLHEKGLSEVKFKISETGTEVQEW